MAKILITFIIIFLSAIIFMSLYKGKLLSINNKFPLRAKDGFMFYSILVVLTVLTIGLIQVFQKL